jgi:hypothetical protein
MNFRSQAFSRQGFSRSLLCAAATLFAGALAAIASTAAFADPPSRVGRITYAEGDVSFFLDRNEGWRKARLNYPVTNENSIWTQGRSRAEVRIGASAIRVDDNSILDFVAVNDENTLMYLQRGTVNIRTRGYGNENYQNGFTIETRDGRFIVEGNGRYRVDASQDGAETKLTVFAGRARFEGAENALTVDAGRTLVLQGGNARNYRFDYSNESDLDRWAMARDRQWDDIHTRYVRERVISPQMTGYEDLDTYGDWVEDREYGRVWAPRVVSAGWAPYRYGSWTYVSPWGWTWVDDAPWGFAPFHYGRWVTIGSRWCWWPGRYNRRPVYAPALVAWYGSPGVSVSVSSSGSLGWFPLAPHEHYVPRYTNNVTYIRNVNYITNNVTVINPPARYVNSNAGATFVNQNVFINSQQINSNVIVRNPTQLAGNNRPVANLEIAPRLSGAPANPQLAPSVQGGAAVAMPQPVFAGGRRGPVPPVAANPTVISGAQPVQQGQPNAAPGVPGFAPGAPAMASGAKPMQVPNPGPGSLAKPAQMPVPAPNVAGGPNQVPMPPVQPTPVPMAKPAQQQPPGLPPSAIGGAPQPLMQGQPQSQPQPTYANAQRPQAKPAPLPQPVASAPQPAAPGIAGAPQPSYVGGPKPGMSAPPVPPQAQAQIQGQPVPVPRGKPGQMDQNTMPPQPPQQQQRVQQQPRHEGAVAHAAPQPRPPQAAPNVQREQQAEIRQQARAEQQQQRQIQQQQQQQAKAEKQHAKHQEQQDGKGKQGKEQ